MLRPLRTYVAIWFTLGCFFVGSGGFAGRSAIAQLMEPKKPRIPGGHQKLGDMMGANRDSATRYLPSMPRIVVDESKLTRTGIRKLVGKRLTLYTDLPSEPWIDELPEVFDQAFPQYCAYFNVDPAKIPDWNLTGFLMNEKGLFVHLGLLPKNLPAFQHGFAVNHDFWLYKHKSEYYTRHLVLHEGVHCFMNTLLGSCGPPWYMEGIAELLSTHRWKDGKLTANYMPENRDEVPLWGRVRIIKDAMAANEAMKLKDVIDYQWGAHLETKAYAWSWAAAVMMDRHPRYQARFRQLPRIVVAPDFNQRFRQAFAADWELMQQDWQLFINNIEYGHDIAATAVDYRPGKPLPTEPSRFKISASRGWQNTGLQLIAGESYSIRAVGRYQVDNKPQVWWCEPGGVSIRYYHGQPLGILQAAVRPEVFQENGPNPLLHPDPIGLSATYVPKQSGTLYMRINDSAAEMKNNAGQLWIEVKRE